MSEEAPLYHIWILAFLLVVIILNQMLLIAIGFFVLIGYLAYYTIRYAPEGD